MSYVHSTNIRLSLSSNTITTPIPASIITPIPTPIPIPIPTTINVPLDYRTFQSMRERKMPVPIAHMRQNVNSSAQQYKISWFMACSSRDRFDRGPVLFSIAFVSLPAYNTYTHNQ